MVLLVNFNHVGQFDAAGAAPGRPKIQQDHLAFAAGDGQRLAREILFVKVGKSSSGDQRVLDFFHFNLLRDHGENFVRSLARLGSWKVVLDLLEHPGGFLRLVEHLQIQPAFHGQDLRQLFGILALVLRKQEVELLEFGGEVAFGFLFRPEFGVDARDEILQLGGRTVGLRREAG